MSLLLEALKKAEKAKEEAQRRVGEPAARPELALEESPRVTEPKHVVTRPELPDISQPLEIASDEIAVAPAAGPSLEPGPAATAAPAPMAPMTPAERPRRATEPEAPQAERAAARKVFEAKFKEPNPRMPFYITMGLLSACALGTAGYFWYQLRPPPALVNANPARNASEPPPPAAAAPAVAAANAPAAAAAQPAIPGLPGAAQPQPAVAAAPAPGAAPAAATSSAPATAPAGAGKPAPSAPATAAATATPPAAQAAPSAQAQPARQAAQAPAREAPRRTEQAVSTLTFSRPGPHIHPGVEAGYAAFMAGDLATARAHYQQALRDEPSNRDAILGLAAVEVRGGRFDAAEPLYQKLLQADPRDSHALAGIMALRGARTDPVLGESRVKNLLAADPGAHVLYFTLGNQLAQQGRWAEAQQQYFKAFVAEPENADFAYNVAVSLDHLRQNRLAIEYYQRALALAQKSGGSFDSGAARERLAALSR